MFRPIRDYLLRRAYNCEETPTLVVVVVSPCPTLNCVAGRYKDRDVFGIPWVSDAPYQVMLARTHRTPAKASEELAREHPDAHIAIFAVVDDNRILSVHMRRPSGEVVRQ